MAKLKEHHKTVVRGTFWGLAGTVALKLVSFIYVILIARLFTQQDVGDFNLALSIMYTLAIFGDLGINAAMSRYVPYYIGKGEKEKAYGLLAASYKYAGALSIGLGILLMLFAQDLALMFGNPNLVFPIQAMAVFLLFSSIFGLNTGFLASLKMVKENNFLLNLQNLLKLALMLVLFFALGANMAALCISFVLSYLIATIISFYYVNGGLRSLKIEKVHIHAKEQLELMKEVVPFGLALAIITAFWSISTYFDRMMVGLMMPPPEASVAIAVYSMAIALASVISIFPAAVTSIFLPIISELHGGKKNEESERISASSLRWLIFLTAPLTIIFIAFPEDILQMFYGSAYASGALVLSIFSAGMFIRSLSYIHGMIIASRRIISIEAGAAVAATGINIGLNVLLIPAYGITGAALSSAISFLAISLINIFYCRKISGFGFAAKFYRPIFAALLTLALLLLLNGPILALFDLLPMTEFGAGNIINIIIQKMIKLAILGIMFAATIAAYAVFLSLTRSFEEEDADMFSAVCRRAGVPGAVSGFAKKLMRVNSNG